MKKEQDDEAAEFGEKEKFVTSAYRRKLEEDAKWLADEKQREADEERDDVTKKTNMDSFYVNLFSGNTATGTAGTAGTTDPEKRGRKEREEDDPLPHPTPSVPVESEWGNRAPTTSTAIVSDRPGAGPLREGNGSKEGARVTGGGDLDLDLNRDLNRDRDSPPGTAPPSTSVNTKNTVNDDNHQNNHDGRTNDQKRSAPDAAAARERYLARKRSKMNSTA